MRLGRIALEHNVKILLKNLVTDRNGHFVRGACSEPYEISAWIDSLNREIGSECFGFCMDVSVCKKCRQGLHEYIVALGKRIDAVVISESECNNEGGYQRTLDDWKDVIMGFREIGFDGIIIMEYSDSMRICPLKLKPNLFALASGFGEHFKWQIGIENALRKYNKRVLFGAGKMCSNYMKYYGEQYPPLFTCDNNSALWGSMVEGLEVKSPEALRDIPKDCVIFICNIYYDEINNQLLDMGVENPIERFNDEFLYETEKEI
jgi:hypothetical protein